MAAFILVKFWKSFSSEICQQKDFKIIIKELNF